MDRKKYHDKQAAKGKKRAACGNPKPQVQILEVKSKTGMTT